MVPPQKALAYSGVKACNVNVLMKNCKNEPCKKFMRSSPLSLPTRKNSPQNIPWWILSSPSLDKNEKNMLGLSQRVNKAMHKAACFCTLKSNNLPG